MYANVAKYYDAIYSFKNYVDECTKLNSWIDRLAPHAATLLDVACGSGKHLQEFGKRFEIYGVDYEPQFVEMAKKRLPTAEISQGDYRAFDLGRGFDVVTCLFSAIGHVTTETDLRKAVSCMASHLNPGGVLIVEPWLRPDGFLPGHFGMQTVNEPELKIARINTSRIEEGLSVMDMHYLIATPEGVEAFVDTLRMGLFTHEQMLGAFEAAGLETSYDAEGLMGRGLYFGARK